MNMFAFSIVEWFQVIPEVFFYQSTVPEKVFYRFEVSITEREIFLLIEVVFRHHFVGT